MSFFGVMFTVILALVVGCTIFTEEILASKHWLVLLVFPLPGAWAAVAFWGVGFWLFWLIHRATVKRLEERQKWAKRNLVIRRP